MAKDQKSARRNQRKQQNRIKTKLMAGDPHCFQRYRQWQEVFRHWEGADFTFHDMDLEMQRRGFSEDDIIIALKRQKDRMKYARQTYVHDRVIAKQYNPRIKPITKPVPGSTAEAMSDEERTLDRYKCYKIIQEESLAADEITSEQLEQYLANYREEHNLIVDT